MNRRSVLKSLVGVSTLAVVSPALAESEPRFIEVFPDNVPEPMREMARQKIRDVYARAVTDSSSIQVGTVPPDGVMWSEIRSVKFEGERWRVTSELVLDVSDPSKFCLNTVVSTGHTLRSPATVSGRIYVDLPNKSYVPALAADIKRCRTQVRRQGYDEWFHEHLPEDVRQEARMRFQHDRESFLRFRAESGTDDIHSGDESSAEKPQYTLTTKCGQAAEKGKHFILHRVTQWEHTHDGGSIKQCYGVISQLV